VSRSAYHAATSNARLQLGVVRHPPAARQARAHRAGRRHRQPTQPNTRARTASRGPSRAGPMPSGSHPSGPQHHRAPMGRGLSIVAGLPPSQPMVAIRRAASCPGVALAAARMADKTSVWTAPSTQARCGIRLWQSPLPAACPRARQDVQRRWNVGTRAADRFGSGTVGSTGWQRPCCPPHALRYMPWPTAQSRGASRTGLAASCPPGTWERGASLPLRKARSP